MNLCDSIKLKSSVGCSKYKTFCKAFLYGNNECADHAHPKKISALRLLCLYHCVSNLLNYLRAFKLKVSKLNFVSN